MIILMLKEWQTQFPACVSGNETVRLYIFKSSLPLCILLSRQSLPAPHLDRIETRTLIESIKHYQCLEPIRKLTTIQSCKVSVEAQIAMLQIPGIREPKQNEMQIRLRGSRQEVQVKNVSYTTSSFFFPREVLPSITRSLAFRNM